MGIRTAIEYCDSTANPVPGCSGCELYHPDPAKNHCYAAELCVRWAGHKGWPPNFTEPTHFPGRLEKAIRWPDLTGTERPGKPWLRGMPRVIFVNDIGDLFSPASPDPNETIMPLLEDMANSPHIYLVLTKWPARMVDVVTTWCTCFEYDVPGNVLWGTTVTHSRHLDRIDELLGEELSRHPLYRKKLGDMRKWISLEPALDLIDLGLRNWPSREISFVAAGGESGKTARLFRAEWARIMRDDCQAAGVPFFLKQLGSYQTRPYSKRNDWAQWQPDLRVREMFHWSLDNGRVAVL
jgi:protein gp37